MFSNQENEVHLTKRELDILDLLAKGHTNIEIGRILNVSKNTVKAHISHIYAKFNVTNRTEAVLCYTQLKSDALMDARPTLVICLFDDQNSSFASYANRNTILQSKLMSLLSKRRYLKVVKGNASDNLLHKKSALPTYCLSGNIIESKEGTDIHVCLEYKSGRRYIWSQVFKEKSLNSSSDIETSVNRIVATSMYNLISKESINMMEYPSDKKSTFSNILIGFHLIHLGTKQSLDHAKLLFNNVLKTQPTCITALYGKCFATYLCIFNDYSEDVDVDILTIKDSFQKVLSISKESAETWFIQGLGCTIDNDLHGAILSLNNTLRIDPSCQEAYLLLSQLYILNGNESKGFSYLEKGIHLCPPYKYQGNNPIIVNCIYFALEQYDQVIHLYEECSYRQEGNKVGHLIYLCSLYLIGEIEKAKKLKKDLLPANADLKWIGCLTHPAIIEKVSDALLGLDLYSLRTKDSFHESGSIFDGLFSCLTEFDSSEQFPSK